MMLLLLLTVLVAGCGGDDADESVPALTFDGTDPNTTSRSRQLAGDFEPGAVVQVTVDTTAVVNVLKFADGRWSCTIDALAPGSNLVTILATDSTGNQNALLLSLLYDPVSIERWVTPIPGTTLTIGGLVDPAAASRLEVTVDTVATPITPVVTGDHWEAVLSGLSPENNVVTVRITHPDVDVAEVVKTLTLNVNTAAPVVTIDPVDSPTNVNSQLVTGTRENDLGLILLAPTAAVEVPNLNTSGIWSATLNKLQQGKNPFTVSATAGVVTATAHDLIVYDAPPEIVSTIPADAAVNVSPATQVQAFFNEPMQESTLNNTTFIVACQEIPVGGTVTYAAATRTATFTPDAPLLAGACTATLRAAITDLGGNALIGNAAALPDFSWSFTVN
jgi:hypothetical protein